LSNKMLLGGLQQQQQQQQQFMPKGDLPEILS
jgi:hypothetical protein